MDRGTQTIGTEPIVWTVAVPPSPEWKEKLSYILHEFVKLLEIDYQTLLKHPTLELKYVEAIHNSLSHVNEKLRELLQYRRVLIHANDNWGEFIKEIGRLLDGHLIDVVTTCGAVIDYLNKKSGNSDSSKLTRQEIYEEATYFQQARKKLLKEFRDFINQLAEWVDDCTSLMVE